jgi:hypothetical protein
MSRDFWSIFDWGELSSFLPGRITSFSTALLIDLNQFNLTYHLELNRNLFIQSDPIIPLLILPYILTIFPFQNAKKELISAFQREELGNWLKKPIEQDQFPLLQDVEK